MWKEIDKEKRKLLFSTILDANLKDCSLLGRHTSLLPNFFPEKDWGCKVWLNDWWYLIITSWTHGLSLSIGSIHISKLISKAMRRKHQITEHSFGPHLVEVTWHCWESLTTPAHLACNHTWHYVCTLLWFWPFGGDGEGGRAEQY